MDPRHAPRPWPPGTAAGRSPLAVALGLALALLSAPGCASLRSASYSVPSTAGGRAVSDRAGLLYLRMSPPNGVWIERGGAQILVRSRPSPAAYSLRALGPGLPLLPIPGAPPGRPPPRTVYLEVQYGSRSGPFRLDPNRIGLVGETGERLRPVAASVPVRAGQREAYYTPDSQPLRGRSFTAEPGTRWCVVLEFYRPDPQGWNFTVEFDGVWVAEQPVALAPIEFREGRAWLLSWAGGEPACE